LGTVRLRHGNLIRSLTFSPDGKVLASAGLDGIRFWEPATGTEVRRLGDSVDALAFSPDGTRVAAAMHALAAAPGEPVRMWETSTGKACPWPAKHVGRVIALAFSPDGKLLVTSETLGGGIRLWEVATGNEVRRFKGAPAVTAVVAFSSDGKWLLSGCGRADKTLYLWNVASGELARLIRTEPVYAIAFSPGGKTFASAGADGSLRLWDTATGESVRRFEGHRDLVLSVAFSHDGRTLVSGGMDHTVRLWDVASGREIRQLTGPREAVTAVSFSPDCKMVVAGGRDQRVRLWDANTGRELHHDADPEGIVWAVAVSPDGKTLASGGQDHVIRLWDAATHKPLRRLEGHTGDVVALAFSPDGKSVASASAGPDKTLRVWETATGQELRHFTADHPAGFSDVAFSPDGKRLAASSHDQTVRLWDITTGKPIRVFRTGGMVASRVCFTGGGETLIAAGFGQNFCGWSVNSGIEVSHVESKTSFRYCMAVSDDGRNLAGQDDEGHVIVWELATGQERARIPQKELVWSLAFSADGEHLVGALNSGALCVWDLAAAQEAGQLPGNSCLARSLTCSADGKTLVSGGSDGTILLWDAARLPQGKRPAPRELSTKELEDQWQALGRDDATGAYRALWALRSVPRQALPLLKRDLRPASAADLKRITRLVAELDSDDFAVRERATAELEKLGGAAEAALSEALEGGPSAEVRMRVQQLLEKASRPVGARLRALRMLELLERIGTPEARELLKTLADNESDVWLARQAKAAEVRLRARDGAKR
jgi:WD40 repeat protein